MFKPVEQIPRYRLVAQQIAERILEGDLKAGQKMPAERELVEQLSVSRATVREALIALEISGFVENRFGAGMQVSTHPPSTNTLSALVTPGPFELLEARLLVEGETAALAADHITDAELEKLEELTEQMSGEHENEFWGDNADELFHLTIARATRNLALENTVLGFWRQRVQLPMWVKMHGRVNVARMKPSLVQEHRAIIEALRKRSAEEARLAMRHHISQFGIQLLEGWKEHDETCENSVSPALKRLAHIIESYRYS
ncbi:MULTISPECIES: FadR/GntR family transcriptional regulator [Halocynthiibacter]|uniref:FadR family transcriptional regulator n=1 Tax=Halocynthiibacter halioticoli TaxID=2986804 RepID=A0AAE3LQJ1_9RHOB|nr:MULTISPECIES: FadR/GntR family transcriptional regulator [Halocynthiibacter]MCV6824487.1 FadR family transcriptional regulator [Halocynthiibacter halioticoli]MCW4057488.1 FadR family transcriptional regulator [Halocynthiibacter sp. SDUM655004]